MSYKTSLLLILLPHPPSAHFSTVFSCFFFISVKNNTTGPFSVAFLQKETMDIIHDTICDTVQPLFPAGVVDKHDWKTQATVYYLILSAGGSAFYLSTAMASYYLTFMRGKDTFFPDTIKKEEVSKQVGIEIEIALTSLWKMGFLMLPYALFAHRGYSKMYYEWPSDASSWAFFMFTFIPLFLFTDFAIYWIHRGLHHPLLYKRIHKLHHTYQYTTPFSSHAFHPVDGFLQGSPYYFYVYLFPVNNIQFFFIFIMVNFWTVNIHDQVDFGNKMLNSTGHHTIHHAQFWYNYGQYFTFWDRVGGTYMPAVQTHDMVWRIFSSLLKGEIVLVVRSPIISQGGFVQRNNFTIFAENISECFVQI